jgi:hypothetical protein
MGLRKEILLNDGFNRIEWKPNTKKVVICMNSNSWYGQRYRSFNCKTKDEALKISKEYINKKSKLKL